MDPAPVRRPRTPPEPFAVKARRAVLARENRRTVFFTLLAAFAVVVVGVYAVLTGKAQQVEAVVNFTPTATVAQKDAVRRACPSVGRAILEPADRSALQTSLTYPLRYDITQADASQKAAIYRCVSAQAGVIGISEYRQGE